MVGGFVAVLGCMRNLFMLGYTDAYYDSVVYVLLWKVGLVCVWGGFGYLVGMLLVVVVGVLLGGC